MSSLKYLKAVVIVHGKSEKQICDFIKQKLRLKMGIYADKNGNKSIQITSLNNTLNNRIFRSKRGLLEKYPDIEMDLKGKKISPDFKIFIIMDTDDCTEKEKEDFINKKMFQDYWLYEYIVPIFNSKNLEEVLIKAGIKFRKKKSKMKEEYIEIFPTDDKYKQNNDIIQIEDFMNKLSKIQRTNMNEFVEFCLKQSD